MEKEHLLTRRLTLRLSDEHYTIIRILPEYLGTSKNQSETIRLLLQAVYTRFKEQEATENHLETA